MFGLWGQPTYEEYVGLWLNLDRESLRKSWETKDALAMAQTGPSPEAVAAVAHNQAQEQARQYQEMSRQINSSARSGRHPSLISLTGPALPRM